tara:strand:+ start:683 stop:1024 length:342 start_codon:yes stop_codon:yes gene_type:complete
MNIIMVKLIKIVKSQKPAKKYDAYFKLDNGKEKIVSFGSSGMRDYTLINDKNSEFYLPKLIDRNVTKASYLRRHRARENWENFLSAGALSRWLLWDRKTLAAAIKAFKKRFKL